MARSERHSLLRQLAMLYLAMAHRADDYLTDAELSSITERLHVHDPALEWASVQDIVLEALDAYARSNDAEGLTRAAMDTLHGRLSEPQKRAVLEDLRQVAGADGVVLDDEQGLLARLSRRWGIDPARGAGEATVGDGAWGVLHDLAYIYLTLAHGTDYELSTQEMQVMRNRLAEWVPQHSEPEIQEVLNRAMTSYARGVDEALYERAIRSVRDHLPQAQRQAALNDLVQIANADGVFLDGEEDLINNLLAAWDIDPYASYDDHGTKD